MKSKNLKIELNSESEVSLYRQIYNKIKQKIIEGEFKVEERLPPIRDMARSLDINPATVVSAYDLLEEEGLIYKKPGSGCYISGDENMSGIKIKGQKIFTQGYLKPGEGINLATAVPSPSLFPVEEFRAALNHVLERDRGNVFTYQKSRGYTRLRETVSSYMSAKGMEVDMGNIQIVSGAQQAIDLLSRQVKPGETVVMGEPTYPGAISAFTVRGTALRGVSLQEDGMDMEAFQKVLRREDVRFVYVMTAFQNPTGITWSQEKKEKLLKLAVEYDFLIIEDDCVSELYYDNKIPRSLKSMDNTDRVIYIKSFSKIFMPGLRLAFLTVPDQLLSPILSAKYNADISCAGLTQRAFEYFLREENRKDHIEKMRKLFGLRYKFMYEEIQNKLVPAAKPVFKPRGGLYFWVELSENMDGEEIYSKVAKKGVIIFPGKLCQIKGQETNKIRLSFAAADTDEIRKGIKILSNLLEDYH